MKPVHVIPAQPSEPWSKYIHVRDGYVFSGNLNTFVRIPAEEVFGKKIIKPDDVLFFSKQLWEDSKIYQANKITRDGDKFIAVLKGEIIGYLFPAGQVGETAQDLVMAKETIKFPTPKSTLQEYLGCDPVFRIGLNIPSLFQVSTALGEESMIVSRNDSNGKNPHIVRTDSGSIGLSAGFPELIYEIVGNSDVDLSESPDKDTDLKQVEFGVGSLIYKTDNLQSENLMERFIELARKPNISELLDDLEMM